MLRFSVNPLPVLGVEHLFGGRHANAGEVVEQTELSQLGHGGLLLPYRPVLCRHCPGARSEAPLASRPLE